MAKIATLVTTFPGTSLPSPIVDGSSGGSSSVAGGRLILSSGDASGEYGYVGTEPTTYDLDESGIYFPVTLGVTATFEAYVLDASGDGYKFAANLSINLNVGRYVAGTPTTIHTVSYNATTMRWWRFREASGVIHFETAPGINTPETFTDRFSENTNTNAAFAHTAAIPGWINIFSSTANDIAYVDSVNANAGVGIDYHSMVRGLGRGLARGL
jgi:hypothetical protein